MEKKQKKGMKKLFISMIAMMLAIVGAATSTYAWFTMTAAPQVGEFEVKVTTVSGLEIALDDRARTDVGGGVYRPNTDYTALDYKTFLSGVEVENYLKSISKPSNSVATNDELVLAPSQTADGKTFTDLAGAAIHPSTAADGIRGKFLNAETKSDVGYLEFSLYFRILDADLAGTSEKVAFDMYNYTGGATPDDHRDNGQDVRTYVGQGTNSNAISFELPTTWVGSANLSQVGSSNLWEVPGYIIVDLTTPGNHVIKGINMKKYLDSTYSGTEYVDPATAEIMTWNGTALTATSTYYNPATNDATGTQGRVIISGQGANALRLSFSEVDNASTGNLTSKATEKTPIVWNPRNNLGKFNNDAQADNFALHMLWATGKADSIPTTPDYADKFITDRSATAATGNLANATVIDFSGAYSDGTYSYGATTIRLWVDGWDAECFNGIMADIANIGFQFKLAA